MVRTQVYLPAELYQEVRLVAKVERKPAAQVIREALKSGLKNKQPKKTAGEALLRLVKLGEKYNIRKPKDLSTNHDKYLYEEE